MEAAPANRHDGDLARRTADETRRRALQGAGGLASGRDRGGQGAPGLTARRALEKFAAVQMIDVHLPTTDGREIRLTRYTHPEPELQLLIDRLKLRLPPQPPPRITTAAAKQASPCSEDLLT